MFHESRLGHDAPRELAQVLKQQKAVYLPKIQPLGLTRLGEGLWDALDHFHSLYVPYDPEGAMVMRPRRWCFWTFRRQY
jgi:hypothetical protein